MPTVSLTEHRSLPKHGREVVSVHATDHGLLLTTTSDALSQVWAASTAELIYRIEGRGFETWKARVSDDGKLIAMLSTDGILRIWDSLSARLLHEISYKGEELAFAFGGHQLLYGGDGALCCVDPADGFSQTSFQGADASGAPSRFIVASGGRYVAEITGSHELVVWDRQTGRSPYSPLALASRARVDVVSSSDLLLIANESHDPFVWSVNKGTTLCVLHGYRQQFPEMLLSATSLLRDQFIALYGPSNPLVVWGTEDGQQAELIGPQSLGFAFEMNAFGNGQYLLSGNGKGTTREDSPTIWLVSAS